MEFDVGVYSLIYEYYEARILCGYYRFDDRLPSIPRISAFFQVAPATVRSALSLLEEKGYVAVNAKRRRGSPIAPIPHGTGKTPPFISSRGKADLRI